MSSVSFIDTPATPTHIAMTGSAIVFGSTELIFLAVEAQQAILDTVAPGEHDETGTITGIAVIGFGRWTQNVDPVTVFADAAKGDRRARLGQDAGLPILILEGV